MKAFKFALFAAIPFLTMPVLADGIEGRGARGVVTFQVENDLFFGATDRDYTNGLRLSYAYEPSREKMGVAESLSKFLADASSVAKDARDRDDGHLYYSFGLGQNMYTPDDIEATEILFDDRPYAGWSYLEFGVTAEAGDKFEALKLDLGIVGPASGAGRTQRWWHRVIGSPRPSGWSNQLPNEPGLNLYYNRAQRFWISGGYELDRTIEIDFTPHVGAALGNVYTHAAAGGTLRIGTDLKRDFGAPPRIQPALPGSEIFHKDGLGAYLFAGIEGRLVGRNIFLDGTWRDHPHSVNSQTWVADLQVGGVIFLGQWRLALTHAWRTKEYVGSDVDQEYGAITLSRSF